MRCKSINSEVAILGLTFKENCSDLRNTKVFTIIQKLKEMQCIVKVTDSFASKEEAKAQFGIDLVSLDQVTNQDAIILAVAHDDYYNFDDRQWDSMLKPNGVMIDVKSMYSSKFFVDKKYNYWRL